MLVISMTIKTGKRELSIQAPTNDSSNPTKKANSKTSVDVGRSLAADRRSKSKTVAKPGYGDQGDQPRRSTKSAPRKTTNKAGKKAAEK